MRWLNTSNSALNSAVTKEIEGSDSFSDVTLAYFNAVDGKDVNYRYASDTMKGKHFEEDREFGIDIFSLSGLDLTKVDVSNLNTTVTVMSNTQSHICFNADGTFEIKYVVDSGLINLLKKLVDWGWFSLPLDLSDYFFMDIKYLQSTYLQHMFPGFDYTDLSASLDLLKETVGLSVEGPDFKTEAMRDMANEWANTGHLVLRSFDVLGDTLAITWAGKYRVQEVTSKLTGETYTAIYLGEDFYNGESYFRFTCKEETEEEPASLRLTVDVVDLVLEGTER